MRLRRQERFADRAEAGRRLAVALGHLRGEDTVVLGLPRGGVPVAAEVARALRLPLDVIVVRKLGFPWQPELAMGAIGEDGCEVLEPGASAMAGPDLVAAVRCRERAELDARLRRLRGARAPADIRGRTVVIVDDGIATGASARVAAKVARLRGAARVVVAAPVAPSEVVTGLSEADEVVVLATPEHFGAVGRWYRSFTATSEAEVAEILAASGDG